MHRLPSLCHHKALKSLPPTAVLASAAQFLATAASATPRPCDVLFERLQGEHEGICVVTLNRPPAKNAFSKKMLAEFADTLDALKFDSDARVVIVRSLVPGVFSAGADLKERRTMPPLEVGVFVDKLRESFTKLENLPQPTIAAIDGAALGGGLELALCADIRTAGKGAKIGLPETKLAIIPGAGGTQRLARLIGMSKAKELVFTGRTLSADMAAAWGIVNHTVEDGYQKALEIASEMMGSGPIALRAAKSAINTGAPLDMATGLKIEQFCYKDVIPTEDRMEGLKAFVEKRKPVYKGR